MLGLAKARCLFTVRSHWDRHTVDEKLPLREVLRKQPSLGSYEVDIGRTGRRAARRATVDVRAKVVTLRFSKRKNKPLETLTLTAVWFRELDASGGEPIDWLLFTNVADHRVAQPDDEPERSRASAAPADAASDAFTRRRSPGDAVPAAA